MQQACERVIAQRFQQGSLGTGLGGPGGHHQQDRQRLDAAQYIDQETQRSLIGPVRVVDGQQQRRAFREVGGKPVQAVEPGEGCTVRDQVPPSPTATPSTGAARPAASASRAFRSAAGARTTSFSNSPRTTP